MYILTTVHMILIYCKSNVQWYRQFTVSTVQICWKHPVTGTFTFYSVYNYLYSSENVKN